MIRVQDMLARTLVPFEVVAHALARDVRNGAFRLMYLEGRGDVSRLHEAGIVDLENALPMDVTWDWLESLSRLLDDLDDMEVRGTLADGSSLLVRCFDSTFWEIAASPEVEARASQRFDEVTHVPRVG